MKDTEEMQMRVTEGKRLLLGKLTQHMLPSLWHCGKAKQITADIDQCWHGLIGSEGEMNSKARRSFRIA